MARFYRGKQTHSLKRLFLSVILFCIVCISFYFGVDSVFSHTKEEQKKSLEEAILRGCIQCYSIEGRYPESLEYLKKEYGIQYDSSDYFVDYQTTGANIMPDITVIEKQTGE